MDDLKYISLIEIGLFFSWAEKQSYDGNYFLITFSNVLEWKFDQYKTSETCSPICKSKWLCPNVDDDRVFLF